MRLRRRRSRGSQLDKKQGSMINNIYDAPQSQLLQCSSIFFFFFFFFFFFWQQPSYSLHLLQQTWVILLFRLSTIYAQTAGVADNGTDPQLIGKQESADSHSLPFRGIARLYTNVDCFTKLANAFTDS